MDQFVSTNGATLRYRVDGPADAPALLLSNSLGTTLELWDAQVAEWARHARVIRYDTRGHGRSSVPPDAYTLDQLGQDALAVLDAAGARTAHVCGISLGGLTAMWLGVHAPHRAASEEIQRSIPGAVLVTFPSAHLSNVELSGEFTARGGEFMKGTGEALRRRILGDAHVRGEIIL